MNILLKHENLPHKSASKIPKIQKSFHGNIKATNGGKNGVFVSTKSDDDNSHCGRRKTQAIPPQNIV